MGEGGQGARMVKTAQSGANKRLKRSIKCDSKVRILQKQRCFQTRRPSHFSWQQQGPWRKRWCNPNGPLMKAPVEAALPSLHPEVGHSAFLFSRPHLNTFLFVLMRFPVHLKTCMFIASLLHRIYSVEYSNQGRRQSSNLLQPAPSLSSCTETRLLGSGLRLLREKLIKSVSQGTDRRTSRSSAQSIFKKRRE